MPTWKTALQIFVVLALVGFALIIVSGYWHVLALIVIGAAVLWLWRYSPKIRK
jgi:hypothetical protein